MTPHIIRASRSHTRRARLVTARLFTDNFNRDDGPLGGDWTAAATWAISANRAQNTPNLGAELLGSPYFDNWTSDDPNGWTVYGESGDDPEVSEAATGELHADTPTPGGGMCNMYSTSDLIHIGQNVKTANLWYYWGLKIDTNGGGSLTLSGYRPNITLGAAGTYHGAGWADGAHHQITRGTTPFDKTFAYSNVKQLTTSELFASRDFGGANADASVKVYGSYAHCGGVILNLDDPDNPANYVIAYINNNPGASPRIYIDKCVGGVFTGIYNSTISYGGGETLRLVKTGTTYDLYLDDTLKTTRTIADAGIVDNTIHGLLATDAQITLDTFRILVS